MQSPEESICGHFVYSVFIENGREQGSFSGNCLSIFTMVNHAAGNLLKL